MVAAYREDEERAHESDLRAWRFSCFSRTTFAIAKELFQAQAQNLDLVYQLSVFEAVRAWLRAHNEVGSRRWPDTAHHVENSTAAELTQTPFESVTLHRRVAVLRNDETDS